MRDDAGGVIGGGAVSRNGCRKGVSVHRTGEEIPACHDLPAFPFGVKLYRDGVWIEFVEIGLNVERMLICSRFDSQIAESQALPVIGDEAAPVENIGPQLAVIGGAREKCVRGRQVI